jgi:hypothetical protein
MGAARSRGQGRSHASERPCPAAAPLRAVRKGLSAAGPGCAASVAESAACLDPGEHGARLVMPGWTVGVALSIRGELALRPAKRRVATLYSVDLDGSIP